MISIVVCTFNRANILKFCLDSFTNQTIASKIVFELLVVDNGSTDTTKEVVNSFNGLINNLIYIYEPKIGLSHARNRGYLESKFDWVVYIDDDAKAHFNLISRISWVIDQFHFPCFGGRFYPWYLEQKPSWLSSSFGLFPELLNHVGELPLNLQVAGGIMVFEKDKLREVGGFPTNLGMTGNKIGYGEENWVQDEFRKRGYLIGFDPELRIDHLVASYKFKLWWHLRRAHAKGKTEKILYGNVAWPKKISLLIRATAFLIYSSLLNITKLFRSDYYIQNYILDSTSYFLRIIGLVF